MCGLYLVWPRPGRAPGCWLGGSHVGNAGERGVEQRQGREEAGLEAASQRAAEWGVEETQLCFWAGSQPVPKQVRGRGPSGPRAAPPD